MKANSRLLYEVIMSTKRHGLLLLLSPSCQVAVEPDPAKLISDHMVTIQARDIDIKINQITKIGTLKKPLFCLLDVINFWFNGIIKQNI